MKKLFRRNRILISILFALSLCVMAPAMAQGDGVGVFMALRLPQQEGQLRGSDDSAVGNFAADALRVQTGADFALLCTGEVTGHLEQGSLQYGDVAAVFSGDIAAHTVQLTPAQLKQLLEALVAQVTIDMEHERIDRTASAYDGFPHISGFTLTYDASAPVGQRIYTLELEDGTLLDLTDSSTLYTVAVSQALVCGSYGAAVQGSQPADMTLTDALYGYIGTYGDELKGLEWDRVTAIGAHDNEIADIFPSGALLAMCIIIPLLCMVWINRRRPT